MHDNIFSKCAVGSYPWYASGRSGSRYTTEYRPILTSLYASSDAFAYVDRAWTGALVLILIVMVLNIIARLIARIFAPKLGR